MAKSIPGNPDLDRGVIERFVQARDKIATAVAEVLGDESAVRNLSQDSLDDIETSLRETRIALDRGFLVFVLWGGGRARSAARGDADRIGPWLARFRSVAHGPVASGCRRRDRVDQQESRRPRGGRQHPRPWSEGRVYPAAGVSLA